MLKRDIDSTKKCSTSELLVDSLIGILFPLFPVLAEKIFDCLDDENLVNSRKVSRSWSEFTDNEVFFSWRIIKKLIDGYVDFKDTWKYVMKKADLEKKELALAIKFFLSEHPRNCFDKNCNHRTLSCPPLHIGVEARQVSLCKFILKFAKNKNPRYYDKGWTPLHEAAMSGHLQIYGVIMNEICDKNPGDN